jgi:hypothetical protein
LQEVQLQEQEELPLLWRDTPTLERRPLIKT